VPLYLPFDPLSRPQYLALQIEAAALLRVVDVEQPLKALGDDVHFYIAHLARPDVQNTARFVHGDVRGGEGVPPAATALARGGIFLRGGGLLVRGGDGAAYNPGAGEDDLCYYAVGLEVLAE
jgi:hypothetical protein